MGEKATIKCYTGELAYDGRLYVGPLTMTDQMLGPSPMHIKYMSYVNDGLCIWRTNFPGLIESVICKFACKSVTNLTNLQEFLFQYSQHSKIDYFGKLFIGRWSLTPAMAAHVPIPTCPAYAEQDFSVIYSYFRFPKTVINQAY